jgi:hypothetical protein
MKYRYIDQSLEVGFCGRNVRPIVTHGAESWRLTNKTDTVLMKRERKMLEKY